MKVVAVCKDTEKFKEFLDNQGSISVEFAFDSIYNNLDTLLNNIVRVDKFIVIHDPNSEFAQEIRGVISLLDSPSGLMRVKEFVFIYKIDYKMSQYKQLLNVVEDKIKEVSESNPRWEAPHMSSYGLQTLDYDSIYRAL